MIDYIYIEPTSYCNLKCSFCNREKIVQHVSHMSPQNFSKIMELVKNEPVKIAKIHGLGEPFMNPEFHELTRIFKHYFPNSYLITATNCQYKINDNFTESLRYLDLLYLSVDGFKENYERDRKPAKWSVLIRFLEQFRRVERFGCKVAVNYVAHKGNLYDLTHVQNEIVTAYGLDDFRINIVQNWEENTLADIQLSRADFDYLRDNWGGKVVGKSEWDFEDCFWPETGLYVKVDGDVIVCPLNTEADAFGNIFTESLDQIRSNKEFAKIRAGCRANQPTEHCVNCSYKQLVPVLKQIQPSRYAPKEYHALRKS
jgi:radical SAM protein with 4Fe4S-binding SPASM domain